MFRLFVVEDDDNIRIGLSEFFDWRAFGVEVTGSAANGQAALDEILKSDVDIVLTDVRMPGMDGLEMSRRLRDAQWSGALVFLSAYGEVGYLQTALRVDADDYVLKPFTDAQLGEAIRRATDKLAQRMEYGRLLHAQRWHALLNGEADADAPPGEVYALSLIHANEKLDALIAALREKPDAPLWTDRISQTEAVAIWTGVPESRMSEEAARLRDELASLEKSVVVLTSETVSEGWRVPILLNGLKRDFSLYSQSGAEAGSPPAEPDEAHTESVEALARQISERLSSGRDAGWMEARAEAIWRSLNNNVHTIRELQDRSLTLVQRAAGALEAERKSGVFEKWRKKTSMLLLECDHVDRVRHVTLASLRALNVLATEKSGDAEALSQIRSAVMGNLGDVSLQFLVEKTGLSKWNIMKIIRGECGCTLNEWVQKLRVEEAKRLLLETNLKIYEISSAVGYSSVDYFSGVFRNRTGVTPEQYRRKRGPAPD